MSNRQTLNTPLTSAPLEQLHHLENRWAALLSQPSWYLTVISEIQAYLGQLRNEPPATQANCKQALYDFFEIHLLAKDFALGEGTGDADAQRMHIDTVVIHHTSNQPGLSPARLSAIELMRLYAPYFADPPKPYQYLKGSPIVSGHERNGAQVFWPYHWLIRNDGSAERLLLDSEIGWHAGNWEINRRSIAVALDDDYEFRRPSDTVLQAVGELVTDLYGDIPKARVFGHREVNSRTSCPSKLFLTSPMGHGWKDDLIGAIERYRYPNAA